MQHSVAPSGHRVILAGLWASVRASSGRHRASARSRRRTVLIASTMLLAGAVVAFHVSWLAFTHTNSAPPSSATSATGQHDSPAAEWIRANLPTGIHVLADDFDPPAGYPPVTLATAGENWTNYSYLLTATTTAPPDDSALATVWKSSVPVAVFNEAEVRCILPPRSANRIRRDLDNERAERIRAGQALQRNSQLALSPTAKATLASGELDLRAAATLTAIVSQVPVTLTRIVVVGPEAAAGMPARALTLYSSEPAIVTQALSGLSPALAPDQVTVGENGAVDLHWPLSVTPMPSVS